MESTFRVLDRTIAILVAVLTATIYLGVHLTSGVISGVIVIAFGIVPSLLLWRGRLLDFGILAGYGLFCCQGAYTSCDAGPNDPWGVLHQAHDWLWLLSPYALVRWLIALTSRPQSR